MTKTELDYWVDKVVETDAAVGLSIGFGPAWYQEIIGGEPRYRRTPQWVLRALQALGFVAEIATVDPRSAPFPLYVVTDKVRRRK